MQTTPPEQPRRERHSLWFRGLDNKQYWLPSELWRQKALHWPTPPWSLEDNEDVLALLDLPDD